MVWINLIIAFLLVFFLKILYDLLRDEAVFVPLPKRTIEKMLRLADVKKDDVVYDLGSGDGRVLIIAVKEFGARAVGIEKNLILYKFSKWLVKKKKLSKKIKVIHGDFFNEDISNATVVVVYLSKKINSMLEGKLLKELRKGTRVVSASHEFPNMKPVKKLKTGHFFSYLYII